MERAEVPPPSYALAAITLALTGAAVKCSNRVGQHQLETGRRERLTCANDPQRPSCSFLTLKCQRLNHQGLAAAGDWQPWQQQTAAAA